LEPPQSAVMSSRRAFGYLSRPIFSHHFLMVATTNAEVSSAMPTDTQAVLSARS